FVTWKEEEENKTISKYVRQRGSKTLKNGDIVMNYHCCRSGTYKPKRKGVNSLKSQGSAKIGISFPAIIKVRQSTENVVVQYFPNHKNHENQLEHFRLSESDRAAVAVLVVDEHKNGKPVAFCFSNKSSEDVFRIYFSAIKNAVGIIETTTFMTDDAPAFYNAWSYVMGTVKNVLLCAWHVTRNWHQNLNKIKNPEKRKIVNKALKAVKEGLCLETFSKLMKQFIQELNIFGKYFQQNYAKRPEKWVYCYRKGLGINTNMYLESP
ncbi:MULE domain-containing protein, partial [Trichonephila clavata]